MTPAPTDSDPAAAPALQLSHSFSSDPLARCHAEQTDKGHPCCHSCDRKPAIFCPSSSAHPAVPAVVELGLRGGSGSGTGAAMIKQKRCRPVKKSKIQLENEAAARKAAAAERQLALAAAAAAAAAALECQHQVEVFAAANTSKRNARNRRKKSAARDAVKAGASPSPANAAAAWAKKGPSSRWQHYFVTGELEAVAPTGASSEREQVRRSE